MSAGNEREFIDHLQSKEGKEQAMKCPLIAIGYLASERMDAAKKCLCGKEECAWWDKDEGQCSILGFLTEFRMVKVFLNDIFKKMPHAGQFTK